jgi:hypothetical protein
MSTPGFALLDPYLDLSMSDIKKHSLTDFLSRPILIDSPTWSTARATGYVLNAYNFPEQLLSNTMYFDKINHFYGFRASMVFRVVINTERFQQGRLICGWFPQGQVNTARYTSAVSDIIYMTQLPRVDFDVGTDTSVVLKVPYVSPMSHYNVTDQTSPFGVCFLTVYSPLISPTGSNNLSVQLWAWCEDVDLAYPARPHSDISVPSRRSIMRGNVNEKVTEQGIKEYSQVVSSKSSSIMGIIPRLSQLLSMPSWVSDVASGLAYTMGASKPLNSTPPTRMKAEHMSGHANADYVDTASSIGLSSQNSLAPLSSFAGSDIDEMSLMHILSIPTVCDIFGWSVDTATDTVLYTKNMCPGSFVVNDTYAAIGYLKPTPLYYVGSAFALWRGSIKFTFKFVKTEFHSGRLLFVYDPGNSATAPTISNTCSIYREVIDVRMCNEYTVTVPYVSTLPFLEFATKSGTAYLLIESKLRAPTSVSSSVNILVEVSAGPDFELAVPAAIGYIPTMTGWAGGPSFAEGVSPEEIAVPQALGMDESSTTGVSRVDPVHPLGAHPTINNVSSALCIGEVVNSLRQVIKRYSLWATYNGSSVGGYSFGPNWVRMNQYPSILNSTTAYPVDYIDYFGPLFGYRRGSIRMHITDYSRTPAYVQKHWVCTYGYSLLTATSPSGTANTAAIQFNPLEGHVLSTEVSSGGIEVQYPFYSKAHCHMNLPQYHASSVIATDYSPRHVSYIQSNECTSTNLKIYRAAGDDFSLGCFLCTVPLVDITAYTSASAGFALV